jgi:tRNA (guanine37-N1)-methyltransferase
MTKHNLHLKVKVLTIFPEMFPGPLGVSLAGNSLKNNNWSLEVIDIRNFGNTKHNNVDDEPFGGGNGLVMRPDVLGKAIDFAIEDMNSPTIFYPSPRGEKFSQSLAKGLLSLKEIVIICGRFEGIDERVIEEYNVRQICIGDYVLSGGEIAAYAILDSIVRLIPGTLANQDTLSEESFNYTENIGTLLEYPQYTRPSKWRDRDVPEVLLSGNHKLIKEWRMKESIRITKEKRPDLLND